VPDGADMEPKDQWSRKSKVGWNEDDRAYGSGNVDNKRLRRGREPAGPWNYGR